MMTKTQIREAVLDRLEAMNGSCNSGHIDHNDGTLRGLIWALTGEDPGCYLTKDVARVLDLAGIPYERRDGRLHYNLAA
jgi:hypothetical protein